MATVAVRRKGPHYIEAGLMGLVLDDDLLDSRDVYRVFGVLSDAAARIGMDATAVLGRAVRCAAPIRASIVGSIDVLKPHPLRTYGMEWSEHEGDFAYRPVSF
jgi:hypothetical protein